MASEKSGETVTSVHLPDELRAWLDEEAAQRDSDRETLLRELLAAHRAVATDDGEVETAVAGATEATVDEQVETFREEFMDHVEDVRERVIQVKRETDTKAPLEHTHSEFADLEALVDQVDDIESEVRALDERLDDLAEDLDAGFENYEEIVEYLLDTTDAVDDRVGTLASAVVETREQIKQFVSAHQQQALADELKLAASQYGITQADCGDCGQTLQIALLTTAECPHCASAFGGVSPKDGIFGSATLETGAPPELPATGETGLETDIETDASVTDGDHPAGNVNWQEQGTGGESDD
jgi:predicted transcriptional regulator